MKIKFCDKCEKSHDEINTIFLCNECTEFSTKTFSKDIKEFIKLREKTMVTYLDFAKKENEFICGANNGYNYCMRSLNIFLDTNF